MKIIVSHDIDHLYWNEHYLKDLYFPGTIYRNSKGLLKGKISWTLYKKRLKCWGRIHKIPELIEFYKKVNSKANFFFGMDNALHLSYKYKKAKPWIDKLIKNGHKVGVHGIAYNNAKQIETEYKRFKNISNIKIFGIRTHYLRLNDRSHKMFDNQGYLYDSSINSIMKPFRVNRMWEIPISIMDASLVENAQLNQDLSIWKQNTLKHIEKAKEKKLPYFVINFHDVYFSDEFPIIREWFVWVVNLLRDENHQFITFEEAVNELNNKHLFFDNN